MDFDGRSVRSAIFVDFDNIFIGLQETDPAAAERFATDPGLWLRWIERGLPRDEAAGPGRARSVLVRSCYLNPNAFRRYRPYFTRSAFSVIDCPPLTGQGKTSTDIHMVMGVLDVLRDLPHIEEFIILSGDADFTPVLLRLRAHDRRTVVLTIGPAAAAYTAASDVVIQEDDFIEHALGITAAEPEAEATAAPRSAGSVPARVLEAIARRVAEEASTSGELLATDLPPIFREFPEFTPKSNWLGFFSLRALTEDLVRRRSDLRMEEGEPWRVTLKAAEEAATPRGPRGGARTAAATAPDLPALRARILEVVREIVAAADAPVVMAKAAQEVIQRLGPDVLGTQWAGEGTFKALLESAPDRDFELAVAAGTPGYVFDPERHGPPPLEVSAGRELPGLPPALAEFVRRIHQLTGAPLLAPEEYALVFEAAADEVNRNGYNLTATSKAVRDRCIESGRSISRQGVAFVLKGITYAGHRFGAGEREDARRLAEIFRNNVATLAGAAQLDLTDEEEALLDEWIAGASREPAGG